MSKDLQIAEAIAQIITEAGFMVWKAFFFSRITGNAGYDSSIVSAIVSNFNSEHFFICLDNDNLTFCATAIW